MQKEKNIFPLQVTFTDAVNHTEDLNYKFHKHFNKILYDLRKPIQNLELTQETPVVHEIKHTIVNAEQFCNHVR